MKNIATPSIVTTRLPAFHVLTHVTDYAGSMAGLDCTYKRDARNPLLSVARLTFRGRSYTKTFVTLDVPTAPTAAEILAYLVNCNVQALIELLGMATAKELVSHRKGA